MKKTNFTNPRRISGWLYALMFLAATLFSANSATAQCSLAINDEVNISLDATDCITEVTPDMVLEQPYNPGCFPWTYVVSIFNLDGTPLHVPVDNILTYAEVGGSFLVYVMEMNSGNMSDACLINVLDKMAPVIDCPIDTVDIFCYQQDTYEPDAYDNCDTSSVTMIVTDELIQGNPCDGSMPFGILRIIDRTYVAVDASGNVSDSCKVTIRVNTTPPGQLNAALRFPIWRTVAGGNPISCSEDFDCTLDGCCEPTGYPVPEYSGVPFLRVPNGNDFDTIYLYPNGYFPCNITVSFVDLPQNQSAPGCVVSFMRVWTVTQWSCTINFVRNYAQVIEIADDNDPVVVCPQNKVITTNSIGDFPATSYGEVDCGAMFGFPIPQMSDACTAWEDLRWDITVTNDMGIPVEFVEDASKTQLTYRVLPLGVNTVRYTVYDLCGNRDECTYEVSVIDDTEPVAICQQYTVVGLTYDGRAEVPATSFDSGSYDDCRLDRMEVKRMDNGVPCGLLTGDGDVFKEYVTFCCEDIGRPVTVILRVYDIFNNWNECMVQVEVQDKLGPSIDCPDNIRVSCETVFNPGTITLEQSNNLFGAATFHDNCDNLTITEVYDVDEYNAQCGVGIVYRTITATDPGQRKASCTQRIDFINFDPFWINQANPNDTNDDVIWPGTYSTTGCLNPADLHPDVTGWPELLEGPCDLVGATWDDDVFFFNDDDADATEACFKIIRHWKVIDWCQHEPDNHGQYLKWKYDQIIMVTDVEGPTITSDCTDKVACTYDSCEEGYIELQATATDVCTDGEELKWHYTIDFNWKPSNVYGSFDWSSKVIAGASTVAKGPDDNGYFPLGTHKIYWTVWDQCGNATSCEYLFTIQNCKKPTPYCLDHIATTLMDMGNGEGMIEVVATDCAPCCLESYHPCGYDVVVSFSSDIEDISRTYDCDDLGFNTVEVWATAVDENGEPMLDAFGEVMQDYCVTKIDIQDNMGVCDDGTGQMVNISGSVQGPNGGALPGVGVELRGSELAPQTTGMDGGFAFQANSHGNYILIPARDGDDADGVTTLDLVLIQKHLLALKEMDSPYTIIAADVDANGKVSAADLFTLRQLILGVNDTFTKTDSWRFVDGNYVFDNPQNPLNESIPSSYIMDNVTQDMTIDFVGVKMGDINHTIALQGGIDLVNRNVEALGLSIDEQSFTAGQILEVPVYADNFDQINGFQLTLGFDANQLAFSDAEAGVLNFSTANLGQTRLEEGKLAISWSEAHAVTAGTDVLFTLYFEALRDGTIGSALYTSHDIASPEAYNAQLEVIGLEMTIRNNEDMAFELYQNTPNPFSEMTDIRFNLPEAATATVKIMDLTGRTIRAYTGNFAKGMNHIQVSKADLDVTGVLYYQLESEGNTATRKMVVIR